jgi:hypothetical protein
MGFHSGGRAGSSVQDVLRDGDADGMDRGRVRHLGSRIAIREEDRGVRMEYSVGRIGSEELGRKTRVLTIMVSVLPNLGLVSVTEY